jgi:hypothetical protein
MPNRSRHNLLNMCTLACLENSWTVAPWTFSARYFLKRADVRTRILTAVLGIEPENAFRLPRTIYMTQRTSASTFPKLR